MAKIRPERYPMGSRRVRRSPLRVTSTVLTAVTLPAIGDRSESVESDLAVLFGVVHLGVRGVHAFRHWRLKAHDPSIRIAEVCLQHIPVLWRERHGELRNVRSGANASPANVAIGSRRSAGWCSSACCKTPA
jgi:hypothetical protein